MPDYKSRVVLKAATLRVCGATATNFHLNLTGGRHHPRHFPDWW